MSDDERTRLLKENDALRRRVAELERDDAGGSDGWGDDLFRLLVENAEEHAIFAVDVAGRIVTWNHGAERVFGFREEEIVGRNFSSFYLPEEAAAGKPARDLERARTEGKAEDEAWRVRKDGSRFIANAVMTPLRDRDRGGRLRGFSRVVRDMTERKRAEQALEESDRRFRLFIDNSPSVNFIKDADGRLIYVDATWERTFRSRAGGWVGRTEDEAWPPEVAARVREADSAAVASEVPVESLMAFPSVRGETKWAFFRFAYHDSAGRRLIGGTGIDVTERERAREELRRLNEELECRVLGRTAELTAANEELSAFCYSVSHDLRSPLRGIDGFSQALLEDCSDRLAPADVVFLHRIRGEAQRMGQLIDDLLDLSRVSRAELRRERVDLSRVAEEVVAGLRSRDPGRRVEFLAVSGAAVEADARLVRIVLENLLGNAWKFTGKRPAARIEFGRDPLPDGTDAWFVRDNGVGFDMAYAAHLFGAFQRLHAEGEFPGTGIGLATVQRIVHRHGGRVWADSAPDRGAAFFFTLEHPRRGPDPDDASDLAPAQRPADQEGLG